MNVFVWTGELEPLRTMLEEKEQHADLILMTDRETGNLHFCVIKNFSRVVSSQVSNTTKTRKHIPSGFGFHLVSPFADFKPILTGEKPEVFVKRLIEEIRAAHLGLGKKEIEMTAEDWENFEQSTVCWLCEKEFEDEGKKNQGS